jgi:DNA polymerase III delta prime subunit
MYSEPSFISKYTPSHLRDFELDDGSQMHVAESKTTYILKTLMEIGDLNILLFGGLNSGKTTMLYALLREYYGIQREAHIPETNVMFINNLKEQGIQYFRNELKTFSQSNCSIFGKKKIIVVDDLDYIPKQSQQVFRNCIDKYKSNVQFIASCSNTQKVVESLQSRLHIIRLTPPSKRQMELICDHIVNKEVICIDEASKQYLVEQSNESVRNIMNNLEKLKIYSTDDVILSKPTTKQLCSNISYGQFEKFIQHIKHNQLQAAIRTIYDVYDYGYSVIDILEYLFVFIKQTHLLTDDDKYRAIPHLCEFIVIFHNFHENPIELAILSGKLVKEFSFSTM